MNKQTEKFIKEIEALESTGRFCVQYGCGIRDREEPVYYNDQCCKVFLTIEPKHTEDEIAGNIAKAYLLVDKAEREHIHAISHPNPVKSLLSYYQQR